MFYNKNVHNKLTADFVGKILGTIVDHEDNSGLMLDIGELHYFDLDEVNKGARGKHMDFSAAFMNKIEEYIKSLGFSFGIFGCCVDFDDSKTYEVTVYQGFGNNIYKTEEFDKR